MDFPVTPQNRFTQYTFRNAEFLLTLTALLGPGVLAAYTLRDLIRGEMTAQLGIASVALVVASVSAVTAIASRSIARRQLPRTNVADAPTLYCELDLGAGWIPGDARESIVPARVRIISFTRVPVMRLRLAYAMGSRSDDYSAETAHGIKEWTELPVPERSISLPMHSDGATLELPILLNGRRGSCSPLGTTVDIAAVYEDRWRNVYYAFWRFHRSSNPAGGTDLTPVSLISEGLSRRWGNERRFGTDVWKPGVLKGDLLFWHSTVFASQLSNDV